MNSSEAPAKGSLKVAGRKVKALSGGVYENEGAEKNRLNFCS